MTGRRGPGPTLSKRRKKYEEDILGRIKKLESLGRDEFEKRAREILVTAIQRLASSTASEVTTTTVPIPSDDLKGKIIGRKGEISGRWKGRPAGKLSWTTRLAQSSSPDLTRSGKADRQSRFGKPFFRRPNPAGQDCKRWWKKPGARWKKTIKQKEKWPPTKLAY